MLLTWKMVMKFRWRWSCALAFASGQSFRFFEEQATHFFRASMNPPYIRRVSPSQGSSASNSTPPPRKMAGPSLSTRRGNTII
jgi:hypothetical protein